MSERDTEKETETERETDRQTDRDRDTDRQTDRHRVRRDKENKGRLEECEGPEKANERESRKCWFIIIIFVDGTIVSTITPSKGTDSQSRSTKSAVCEPSGKQTDSAACVQMSD